MNRNDIFYRSRCAALGMMAGLIAAGQVQGALAATTEPSTLLKQFFAVQARPDGAAVFWLLRATEYAVIDGKAEAASSRVVISAMKVKKLANGNYELPYAEQIVASSSKEPGAAPKITGPFLGVNSLDQAGILTQEVNAKGAVASYRGYVRAVPDFDGQTMIEENFDIKITREGSAPEALIELSQLRPWKAGRAKPGFLPAQSVTTVTRPQLPKADWPGKTGYLTSAYVGQKYATLDEAFSAMSADERKLFAPFAASWEALLGK